MGTDIKGVAIIGTGFSGLAMAIRLKKAGLEDFVILEQSNDVGGTWRDNTYPGAACDVPSHVYSFSFEPNPHWTSKFSPQKEILRYLQHCAEKYGLRPFIRFGSRVQEARYDSESGLWTLSIEGREPLICRQFVLASGGLSRPSYPKIPGIDTFKGALFHSARWNHSFPLDKSRVGVIGTGASSIQIVPAIAPQVGKLSLFQRTPAWIMPKPERRYTNFEKILFERFALARYLARKILYWQFELKAIGLLKPILMRIPEKDAKAFIDREIESPELRAKLTPSYTMGCKRVLLSNEFYKALNRENVEVVGEGIERITERGIVTRDGREHILDAIICATGFQVTEHSAPFPIHGSEGRELSKQWSEGAEGYLGVSITGFPNLFTIVGPNSGLGHNSIVFMIEAQVNYILKAIQFTKQKNVKSIEVKPEVQDRYNKDLSKRFTNTVWSVGKCDSWYKTASGKNTTIFPGFSFELRMKTRRFHAFAYKVEFEGVSAKSRLQEKMLRVG